ncbi:tetratricopeptide repeat protein [Catenulispora rubra]|uniref:tetratricopeptide repeat protein n=1 Tax=Catenulispora rubra TaxID=280293 RepID=UPI0018924929|nr:tetratricopeptide repeat protein [Catenulispora rubra]
MAGARDPQGNDDVSASGVSPGSSALSEIADMASVPIEVLEAIESRFDDTKNFRLDPGIATLAQRLAEHRLASARNPVERAQIHRLLAARLHNAGLRQQALDAAMEAVTIHREMGADGRKRETAAPDFAAALTNLAVLLSDAGREEEAVAIAQEAVERTRVLAADRPGQYRQDLVIALTGLAKALSRQSRPAEAIGIAEEAVSLCRELVLPDADARISLLAQSVANLGSYRNECGRREEALEAVEEAVGSFRDLAGRDPAAYDPDLARALAMLGQTLEALDRRAEALSAHEEAIAVLRRPAELLPAAHLDGLAASLLGVGHLSDSPGRAVEAFREAVGVGRQLVAGGLASHEPKLAATLSLLGDRLAEVGFHDEAVAAAQEAVEIFERLAALDPPRFQGGLQAVRGCLARVRSRRVAAPVDPQLARAADADRSAGVRLVGLSLQLWRSGREQEALAAAEQAVTRFRTADAADADETHTGLATALMNLAGMLGNVGRAGEAIPFGKDSVTAWKRAAMSSPGRYDGSLVEALSNLGRMLWEHSEFDDALEVAREEVDWSRRLAEADLEAGLLLFAEALDGLVVFSTRRGLLSDALDAAEESVQAWQALVRADPLRHDSSLGGALGNLCKILTAAEREEDALRAARAAVTVFRALARREPDRYTQDLEQCLSLAVAAADSLGYHDLVAALRPFLDAGRWDDAAETLAEIDVVVSHFVGEVGVLRSVDGSAVLETLQDTSAHAQGLLIEHYRTRDRGALIRAVQLFRLVADNIGPDGEKAVRNNLANALRVQFETTGDAAAFAEAIEIFDEVLAGLPDDDPATSAAISNLALAWHLHYYRTHEPSSLTRAVDLWRSAVASPSDGPPSRFERFHKLGGVLDELFEIDGDPALLEEAADAFRQASAGDPQNPEYLTSMLGMLNRISERTYEASAVQETDAGVEIQTEGP